MCDHTMMSTVAPHFNVTQVDGTSANTSGTPYASAHHDENAVSPIHKHVVGPIFSPDSNTRATLYPGNLGIGSKTTAEKVLEAVVFALVCLNITIRSAGQVLWLALFTG